MQIFDGEKFGQHTFHHVRSVKKIGSMQQLDALSLCFDTRGRVFSFLA
jgi:hypothetical protein